MKIDSPTVSAVVAVGVLCVFAVIFAVFGNITHDLSSNNIQEKTDAETLSEINQLGLLYQKNKDVEKFEKQMKLMQEEQKVVTPRYLGINISEIYIKEKWNFPFMEPSDVVIHNPELIKPVCKIPENIPYHLQNIRQSEMFQIFAEKYSQHHIMIDISDERYAGGLIHYTIITTSENESFTASTNFHLDSCTGEMKWSNNLSCKDTRNDEHMYTAIKSEIYSSLENKEFCNIKLESWHQDLRIYQIKISDELHKLTQEKVPINSDGNQSHRYFLDFKKLGLLLDITRHYESSVLDTEKLQEDLKEYDRIFGSLPDELLELLEQIK